ncbi:MAG: hypothetical protein ABSF84_02205 [Acidimicrobiales bacterium]|jgi:hypothetical protein
MCSSSLGLSATASALTPRTSSSFGAPALCSEPAFSLETGIEPAVGVSTFAVAGPCAEVFPTVSNSLGQVSFNAEPPPAHLNAPVVGIAAARSSSGYWLVAADGGVFALGGVGFFGSAATMRLDAPIVGIAITPDDRGYYLVASDGGVFAFGDAVYQGSMGGRPLRAPVVGIATDPLTGGYRLVAADGGVFDFGAPFLGSMAGTELVEPVVGIATDPTTGGYWLAASDGGAFAFGSPFFGSWVTDPSGPIVGIASAPDEHYWILDRSGNLADCSTETPESGNPGPPSGCFT